MGNELVDVKRSFFKESEKVNANNRRLSDTYTSCDGLIGHSGSPPGADKDASVKLL